VRSDIGIETNFNFQGIGDFPLFLFRDGVLRNRESQLVKMAKQPIIHTLSKMKHNL
jgi:hypothetical protein